MVQPAAVDPIEADDKPDLRRLGRMALWAGLATSAVVAAFVTAHTESGLRRISAALDGVPFVSARAPATVAQTASTDTVAETRRLEQAVKSLAADRDRVLARLSAIERTIEATGSVSPSRGDPRTNASDSGNPVASVTLIPPPVAGAMSDAGREASAADSKAMQTPEAASPAVAAPPADSVVTRTQFGIDLGAAGGIEALRELWNAARAQHAPLLDNLQPLLAVRETTRPGAVELHLIVGPVVNAVAAARLCAVVGSAGGSCQPSVFEGQRLALR